MRASSSFRSSVRYPQCNGKRIYFQKIIKRSSSMVEHDVALIVGCMPAFAAFIKSLANKYTVLKAWLSEIVGSSIISTSKLSQMSPQQRSSSQHNNRRGRACCYELDNSILNTQTSVTIKTDYNQHRCDSL
ncbi:hypothetical protein F4810DRAFT_675597, partial [Camillea tinctor]